MIDQIKKHLVLALIMGVAVMMSACGGGDETAVTDAVAIERLALLNTYCDENPDRCFVEGDPDSEFVVHEFSDYACPHCRAFIESQYPLIKENLIDTGKIKYVTIPAPILGTQEQPATPNAVNGMLCAADEQNGVLLHKALFAVQTGRDHSDDTIVQLGEQLSFNMATFEPCVRNHSAAEATIANRAFAFEADVAATPTLYFNGASTQASYQWLNQALFDAQ